MDHVISPPWSGWHQRMDPDPPQTAPLGHLASAADLVQLKDPMSCLVSKRWWYLHGPQEGSQVDQSKNRCAASFFVPPADLKSPEAESSQWTTLCPLCCVDQVGSCPDQPPPPEYFGSEPLSCVLGPGRRGRARIPRCETLQSSSKHVKVLTLIKQHP